MLHPALHIILDKRASSNVVTEAVVSGGTGTNIGDKTGRGGLAAAFDGNTSQNTTAVAAKTGTQTSSYCGKNYSGGKAITRVLSYGSNDGGYSQVGELTTDQTLNLRGKATSPASASDGTLLGTITFANTDNESSSREIASNDQFTKYEYVWVEQSTAAQNGHSQGELVFYENTSA